MFIRWFKYKEEVNCFYRFIESVLDEIEEIEIVICLMENIELEENEFFDDVEENLERMCDFFVLWMYLFRVLFCMLDILWKSMIWVKRGRIWKCKNIF